MKPQLISLDYTFTGSFMIKEICAPYFINNHHYHNDYELVLVLESSGKRIIGNHVGNFKKGDIVLVGPRLSHAWFNDREYYDEKGLLAQSIVTYFKKNWLEQQVVELSGGSKFKDMLERAQRGIKINGEANERITRLLTGAIDAPELLKASRMLAVLHELAETTEYELFTDESFSNSVGQHEAARINQVYEYIMKNFATEIKLETVAGVANMSPNAFSRYFKSRTQKTFSLFVNEVRIGHACKLLQRDDFSVSQVCYAAGFQSMTNFTKFFKRLMKKSPLQYRKDLKNISPAHHIRRPNAKSN